MYAIRSYYDVLGIYARTLVSLSEGEVLQLMKSADPSITEAEYLRVVYHKTASLIAAASETGSVLAGADRSLRKRMFEFGKAVGIAFQLVDDILDYTGTEGELGKRPLQDLREGKVTLPLIHALRRATAADRARAAKIVITSYSIHYTKLYEKGIYVNTSRHVIRAIHLDQNRVVIDIFSCLGDDLPQDGNTFLDRSPITILTSVGVWGEEGTQEIPMGRMELYSIVPGFPDPYS